MNSLHVQYNIVNKSENEDNLHKLAATSTLTDVTDVKKWNITDVWLRSHSKMLHFMCQPPFFKYHDIRKLYHHHIYHHIHSYSSVYHTSLVSTCHLL